MPRNFQLYLPRKKSSSDSDTSDADNSDNKTGVEEMSKCERDLSQLSAADEHPSKSKYGNVNVNGASRVPPTLDHSLQSSRVGEGLLENEDEEETQNSQRNVRFKQIESSTTFRDLEYVILALRNLARNVIAAN